MLVALAPTTMNHVSDKSDLTSAHRLMLARIAKHADKAAFEDLFNYFGPRLVAFMQKAGAERAQAEDLMQDVMIKVWQKAPLYERERGTVAAWIFTIARNTRIDQLRRKSSRPYEDVYEMEIAADIDDAEEETQRSQESDRVAVALDRLPRDQRVVIEMAYLEGLSQNTIAERLNLPLGTVKSRMRLAYGKLRNSLEDLQ